MKHSFIIYTAAAVLGLSTVLTACDDNFAYPPIVLPESVDIEGNINLLDFKTQYWNALSTPTKVSYGTEGDTIVFTGRVCSSDETGNIFKNIIIQSRDANGEQVAITLSVNEYDLYQLFPFGQEVAVYASGMEIGGYRGLLQFGASSGSEMTFMDVETLKAHVVRNRIGLPEPAKVDTTVTTIAEIKEAKESQDGIRKWQSRLVRLDGVRFAEAGQAFAPTQSITRYLNDENGNRLAVRNSSYASFNTELMPYGIGSVTGILSYYNNDWQLVLIDAAGCANFDNIAPEPGEPGAAVEPTGEGTATSPYNVAKALATGATSGEVYVTGKIASIDEIDTGSFGNATYHIADTDGGQTFKIYRGKWLNGEKFTSEDQLAVGAEVVVRGKIIEYNGELEMEQGNKVYSYNGNTGGETTEPEDPSTLPTAASVAETIALANDTKFTVGYELTVGYVSFKNVFACDAAGNFIQIYGENNFAIGDVIPSGWVGEYTLYNDVTPEIVPVSLPTTTAGTFTPAVVAAADVTTALVNHVITIEDVVLAEASPADKVNFTGTVGDVTLNLRNNYTLASVPAGTYDITVVVTIYNGEPSLYVTNYASSGDAKSISFDANAHSN